MIGCGREFKLTFNQLVESDNYIMNHNLWFKQRYYDLFDVVRKELYYRGYVVFSCYC